MSDSVQAATIWLIPGCPLLAAVLVAFFGKAFFPQSGHRLVIAALIISSVLSLGRLFDVATATRPHTAAKEVNTAVPKAAEHRGPVAEGYEWVLAGNFLVRIDAQIDPLTAVMLTMVTFVSLLIAVYASGYMHGDPGYSRFFAEMALFVFSMCMLVMARNFLVLFIFWEGVGLCSYLLIGFWYERPSASAAAVKAFVMNRIGDAAFLIGLFLMWSLFGTLDFADVFANAATIAETPEGANRVLEICLCLFVGACGKSAQFPLHLWLPDAMEGPTPVSALIHAATMVTAGVYLVARSTPLFILAPQVQAVVATIGAITALLGAAIALTQTDLKRVLAYSTISQLGYMFLALGSAAADETLAAACVTAAIFHMFTHAFFKALLFLSSGNVMHAMGNVIDMRRFGGLKKVLPVTNLTFLCGAAALAGFPFLSGFWSKDEILGVLWGAGQQGEYIRLFQVLFGIGFLTAILTAFYSFRAYFLTFHGPLRIPPEAHAHAHGHAQAPAAHDGVVEHREPAGGSGDAHHAESASSIHDGPSAMTWPLIVLSAFAVLIGVLIGPTHFFAGWIEQVPGLGAEEAPGMLWGLAAAGALAALVGIGIAAVMYAKPSDLPERVRAAAGPLYRLSLNKFYLDEVAAVFVVFPVKAIAFLSLAADQGLVDRLVDFVGSLPAALGHFLRPVQNGLIQSYALVMLFGVVIFLTTILQVWMAHSL
jgi:NADH-quinone oxidoreductase subunit L